MRQRLGYDGSLTVLKGAFALMGGDDGKVEVDELFEFVTGRRNAMKTKQTIGSLASLKLEPPPSATAGAAWTVDEMRHALQAVLIKHKFAPHMLLNAWDVRA